MPINMVAACSDVNLQLGTLNSNKALNKNLKPYIISVDTSQRILNLSNFYRSERKKQIFLKTLPTWQYIYLQKQFSAKLDYMYMQ